MVRLLAEDSVKLLQENLRRNEPTGAPSPGSTGIVLLKSPI